MPEENQVGHQWRRQPGEAADEARVAERRSRLSDTGRVGRLAVPSSRSLSEIQQRGRYDAEEERVGYEHRECEELQFPFEESRRRTQGERQADTVRAEDARGEERRHQVLLGQYRCAGEPVEARYDAGQLVL